MDRYGFTIIEVLLALTILSVGIVAILEGYGRATDILRIAEETLRAVQFLDMKITEVKMMAIKGEMESGEKKGILEWWNKGYLWDIRIFKSPVYKGIDEVEVDVFQKDNPSSRRYELRTFLLSQK